ncbi:hypothetical protein [Synechococcus sp. CBW1108]|uniref:hypothetical protein n=1 Tax=Synechococcus sp. CBW1108 TaxID=1353147 RepID=UPI0018CCE7F5|nr:hypothetical protein [Synechococcus sp. CBW1108]QPN71168.1 hypothetical protein H8F27_06170 [Synechococcus sp. CBW1108]
MGYVHATIELSNPREPDLQPISAQALANSGALMLCIPEHLALQLNLQQESEREVTVADGPRFQERCHPFDPSIRGLEDMTNAPIQRGR